MSGWIKVETGMPEKPEVLRLARLLSIKRDQAVGVVVRFWIWADANTVDGVVDGVEAGDVDDVLSVQGLARALEMVGWLRIDKENRRITIPNFERHNGESAKKRALKSERQARWRDGKVDVSVDTKASTGSSTREEKRRVITPIPPSGAFLRFWSAWPKHQRKQAQGKCWTLWRQKDFDQVAQAILEHVEALLGSEDWRKDGGAYIPAPLVYLRQQRWEGAESPDEDRKKVAMP
jgi:hypothetical protein